MSAAATDMLMKTNDEAGRLCIRPTLRRCPRRSTCRGF
jgi:hypothetical protein